MRDEQGADARLLSVVNRLYSFADQGVAQLG